MRTVMVVEDEKLIRQGIATMIKRTGVPVEEVIECPNGLKAMEVLKEKKVDVVFTDIRMPKMNGIELVQAMKELDSPPIAIAVSGYDDFSYAVEMMRNGVREYILKPVERDKLKEVMEKLEVELSAKRDNDIKSEALDKQLLKYILLDDDAESDSLEMMEKRLRTDVGERYRVLVSSEDDDINEEFEDSKSVMDVDGMVVYLISSERALDLKNKITGSEGDLLSYAGISDVFFDAADLKKAYRQAKARREISFCRDIVLFDKVEDLHVAEQLLENGQKLCSKSSVSARVQLVGTDRVDSLEREWNGFFTATSRGQIPPEDFAGAMHQFAEEFSKTYQREIPMSILRPFSYVSLSDFREKFMEFILEENSRLMNAAGEDQMEARMQMAVRFIRENYASDLNMAVVSNEVSMNYSLFSTAFKNYTGTNFVTYLKELRMEEAKRLLAETDLKVNEISARVGYDNEKHFMKSFKAMVGVSPSEYRKNTAAKNA
ncbi:MAG: response regulator [Butyrivibrio sp.]|nr:response regulator [Butyrivibrio sp.]